MNESDDKEPEVVKLITLANATHGADMVLGILRLFMELIINAETLGLPAEATLGLIKTGMSDVHELNHQHWLEVFENHAPELFAIINEVGPDFCVGNEWEYTKLAEVVTLEFLLNS
jgi:hypothetical protein